MKLTFAHMSIAVMCEWFGITRQAYYQHHRNCQNASVEHAIVLQEVNKIRSQHPRLGARKLHLKLQDILNFHNIKIGRDKFFELLRENKLLVRKHRNRLKTTHSHHWMKKYPNLIHDLTPQSPNHIWASDITYWKIQDRHVYISFITDLYSHKIVGYHVAETLDSVQTLRALKMALTGLLKEPSSPFQLIHHSDRGAQYCEQNYVKLLRKYNIRISMTENGDPLENAEAERLNGIIKQEYLDHYRVKSIKDASEKLAMAVMLYNNDRPHMSIGNHYPAIVHKETMETKKLWRNYYIKKPILVKQIQDH
jgi:transposase InsO family protein